MALEDGQGDMEPEVEGKEEAHLQSVHLPGADPTHLGVICVVVESEEYGRSSNLMMMMMTKMTAMKN